MSDDPTGYKDALEAIVPNSLSERQQRIALGMAMIRDGSSCLNASKTCGIPNSTLHRYAHHISKLGTEEGDGMTVALDELQRGAMVASLIATERVTERLIDPEHEWKDSDLIKAQGVNIDKVNALRSGPQAPANSGISALAQLLASADVTITKRDESRDAIDVQGVTEGD